MKANRLLRPGDRIALGTPIFTPYLEIPELEDYGLEPVYVDAPQDNGFQFTDAELAKLTDPRIKAFFLVNPGQSDLRGNQPGRCAARLPSWFARGGRT